MHLWSTVDEEDGGIAHAGAVVMRTAVHAVQLVAVDALETEELWTAVAGAHCKAKVAILT